MQLARKKVPDACTRPLLPRRASGVVCGEMVPHNNTSTGILRIALSYEDHHSMSAFACTHILQYQTSSGPLPKGPGHHHIRCRLPPTARRHHKPWTLRSAGRPSHQPQTNRASNDSPPTRGNGGKQCPSPASSVAEARLGCVVCFRPPQDATPPCCCTAKSSPVRWRAPHVYTMSNQRICLSVRCGRRRLPRRAHEDP